MARAREDYDDDREEEEEEERPKKKKKSGGAMGVVVPYKNVMALASYYSGFLGLFSFLVLGVFSGISPVLFLSIGLAGFFGLVPILLGLAGFVKARQNPEAHGTAHALLGIVFGILEILTGCGTAGWVAMSGFKSPL